MRRAVPTMLTAMTPFPYFVDVHADLAEARAMMEEHGIRHLPVVEEGKLIGVVSDRDVKRAGRLAEGDAEEDLAVGDAFVERAYMVDVTAHLDDVLTHMWEHRIGSALVLRAGKLAGIFTATDACRLFAEHLRGEHGEPPDEVA